MEPVQINTNAIKDILANRSKLSQFTTVEDKRTPEEYAKFISTSIFTFTSMKENARKFSKINELSKTSQADLTYLIQLLLEIKPNNTAFKIRPIIELYEKMLEDNWQEVKYDREILDATESYNYTAESNIKICESIVKFLKENVLNNNRNYGI